GGQYVRFDRTLAGRVSLIRKKLGDNWDKPYGIKTVWAQGYLLVSDAGDMLSLMGKLFAILYIYLIFSLFLFSGVIAQLWPYEATQQHIALDQQIGKSLRI
ncbi:helix-turn-helix domain-containing protein, partial [Pseudoalteromonas sp. S1650]|uniref:winged helix-turn-helix domain-containing protein n=1 Tax=Pseudoalteromonas sp. S1650 TaxID=579509 RepID=UPI00201789F2